MLGSIITCQTTPSKIEIFYKLFILNLQGFQPSNKAAWLKTREKPVITKTENRNNV